MTDSATGAARRAVEMLRVMADMQAAHNAQVHPEWRTNGYAYYRAIWVECAEMLDHYGWKWWKKQAADINQVKLELVDIWHFALSELLRADKLHDDVALTLADIQLAQQPQAEEFRLAIEALAVSSLQTRSFELAPFARAMAALPMSYAELHAMYIGKNILNRFRQDHGYQAGTYRKTWQGREDNEHLVELLDGLQGEGQANAAGARALPEALYAALADRYAQTA